jgi:hypothetical protein
MQENPPPSTQRTSVHWPTVAQFVLSALAALNLMGLGLTLAFSGMVQRFSGSLPGLEELPVLLLAAGMIASGVLVLPSALYALRRLLGRPALGLPIALQRLRPTLLIFLFPLVLWAGFQTARQDEVSWFVLPVLHVLAVGLPVLWLAYLGMRGLNAGSPQRAWGLLASGLALAPALIFLVEVLAAFVIVILGMAVLSSRPETMGEIESLAERLLSGLSSPAAATRILGPYLVNPKVIFTVFAFVAVIVPLIEELLKPLGVWLLLGRSLSPAEGFAAGLLCGAGYALTESLALASSQEDWAALVFARIGTGVIHILASGLVGWGLASAWSRRSYLSLGLVYLLAVSIHGLWNSLSIVQAYAELTRGHGFLSLPALFNRLSPAVPAGLFLIAAAGFITLLAANRKMRGSAPAPEEAAESVV